MHNRFLRLSCFALALLASPQCPLVCGDEVPAKLVAGSKLESLTVGTATYQNVTVRSVSPRSVTISHDGGMKSLLLHDLAPDLQQRFSYNPEAEATANQIAAKPTASPTAVTPAPKKKPARVTDSKFETLLQQFGQAPEIKTSVDLRPDFNALKLGVKNQGRRPSCSIFAVVSALEFQNAQLIGHAEKFSEEYLLWATQKTLQRNLPTAPYVLDRLEDKDAGFSVQEVVTALRAYGIPLQDSMPNTFGIKMEAISDPPTAVITEARNHRQVSVHSIPGRDRSTRLANIVHALNAGVPVVIGLRWPHYRTVKAGFLSEQKPILDYSHAVTIVGYRSPTGRLEETVFAFKNSYGVEWGMGGFGEATYDYLGQYLLDAMMLEVR